MTPIPSGGMEPKCVTSTGHEIEAKADEAADAAAVCGALGGSMVNVLTGVTVTAPGPGSSFSTPISSGASANFGNPGARGGDNVWFGGLGGNVTAGVGAEGGFGVWQAGADGGVYIRLGYAFGLDGGGGGEGGRSSNMSAFREWSPAACQGMGAVSGCVGGNPAGVTMNRSGFSGVRVS